jgi:hypothetical protein
MKKITDRGRKILSRLFRVISVSVASLILQACYGIMPPDERTSAYGMPPSTAINGRVSSKETKKPIPCIKVSVLGTEYWDYTNKNGDFNFWGMPIKDDYTIKLEDVDGPLHGGQFKEKTLTIKGDEIDILYIDMDLDN